MSRTDMSTVREEGRVETGQTQGDTAVADELSVGVVATPDDGSCGIGTYTGYLLDAFSRSDAEHVHFDQADRSARGFLELAVRVASSGFDVVHVQHEYGLFRRPDSQYPGVMGAVFFPVLFALAAVRGTSVVVTLHSVLNPAPGDAPLRVRVYLLLMHHLLAAADHLVFLSTECERRFREDVPLADDEHSVLPHGVNTTRDHDVQTSEAKVSLGYSTDDTVVMIPGFVRPPKGHDIFVDVARDLPEYEFLVAGGGREHGDDTDFASRITAESPENVTVTGVLAEDKFPVALSAADLAFLPYRVVTQSGTFNWCAAQELPVLASDEPYFARMEDVWGNVETVDIEDRDAVVSRIRALLTADERRRELRERMREFKAANSFDSVADHHRCIYAQTQQSDTRAT